MTVPEADGPRGSLVMLKEIASQVRVQHRKRIVSQLSWENVRPEYKELIKQNLIETETLEETLLHFGLNYFDVQSGYVKYLGLGNENYASQIRLFLQDSQIVDFLIVVPHRKLTKVHPFNPNVDEFLNFRERETLRKVSQEAGNMQRRRFPILIHSEDGIFTREFFEGEEVGKFIRELSDEKELEKVLYACALSQIDFWAHATKREWMPMVHDDDIIVKKDPEEGYIAYLPDLGTPVYHAPAFRVFMEIYYLSYELVQIFNEKQYGRHIILWPKEIRMLFPVILQAFIDSLGREEGAKVISEILANLQSDQFQMTSQNKGSFFSSYVLRFYIERFMKNKGFSLPELSYGRPASPLKLTYNEATPIVDGLREYIPLKAYDEIKSLKLPRPYDDLTSDFRESETLERELRWYKAKAKTFERVSEIILGMQFAPIEKIKLLFQEAFEKIDSEDKVSTQPSEAFYVTRILDYYEKQSIQYLEYPHLLELIYGLFNDFNMVGTIPGDWMRLYRLVQYRFNGRESDSPLNELNMKTVVPNRLGKKIYLQINPDLGKAAMLWHASPSLKNVHAFSVFVDGEFAGVLDFSFVEKNLILERFRLNKRGNGLGTAIVKWLYEYAVHHGIEYIETFEFVHFLHIHVLNKSFSNIHVYLDDEWIPTTKEEAQKLVIRNPTGYRFRFKVLSVADVETLVQEAESSLATAI